MRRVELFSLRRSENEVNLFNAEAKGIFSRLDQETNAHIIIKNEVDRNPKKIATAFAKAIENDDSVDGYIFLNAVDTEDSSSFVDCFTPLMAMLEDAMECSIPYKNDGMTLENHINVHSFKCKGTDIPGYCFYAIGKRFTILPAFETVKDVSLSDFITDAVRTAERTVNESLKKYPDGTIILDKKATKYLKPTGRAKSFFLSFIPCKGDTVKDVIRKIIVLIAIGAFIAGGVILLNFYVFMPAQNQSVISEIQDIFYATTDEVIYATNDEGEVVVIKGSDKNWPGLKKINEEIVAWVKLDGTKIDYPVLEHKGDDAENQFYLYRNYKKDYSDFGSIFVDYRCIDGVNSKNFILHGHNMGSDDSMFGQLIKYARNDGRTKGNPKFYKSAPIVKIDTPQGSEEYVIFALMKIDVSNELDNVFDYLIADFDSSARFMNFVYNIKVRSYLDVNVPINENDQLLTLSTCSYESQNMRTIAVARKIRDNEDVSKYIETATASAPVNIASSTFAFEYAEGNTPWYDGKGKLEGNEDITYFKQSRTFKVQFMDGNGKVISTQIIKEGRDAKAPKDAPRKTADGTYYYVFKGWDSKYTNVTKDIVVKPIFDKKLMPNATKPTTKPTTTPTEPDVPEVIETEPPVIITEAPETLPPETQAPATLAATDPTTIPAPTPEPTEAIAATTPAETQATETPAPDTTTQEIQ